MPIYKGNANQGLIYKGNSVITNVYKGSTLVYRLAFDPVTFTESGTWTVPQGIKQIRVDCVAGQGKGAKGGKGGRVQCILKVNSGLLLSIFVGKQSVTGSLSEPTYNASDIRINGVEYSNRVIVAGGGGNQANSGAVGGAGGGLVGGNGGVGYGGNSSGKGGTQDTGGAGGAGTPVEVGHYYNGSEGTFGLGGGGSYETGYEGPSGGGGAGWYGGGGGAGDWNKNGGYTAGGGGGSSYTELNLCTDVVHTQGFRAGSGYITISMV